MNYFTYEVLVLDRNNDITMKQPFNTHIESKSFYEIQTEFTDLYHIQHIRIKNGTDREVLREHFND